MFAGALKEFYEDRIYTENGQLAYSTTSSKVLDFFSVAGALRTRDTVEIIKLFESAYTEDRLLATKILFYSRDIREGLGERRTFRTLLKYAAEKHPECIELNIPLIPMYGRYDDLYVLMDTPLETSMWKYMKEIFEMDLKNLEEGGNISLLAKWMKTADASSIRTRKLGIKTAIKLGYGNDIAGFKRKVRALRKAIKVTETYMSANKWDEINYPAVPSKAMLNYKSAFNRHDATRFREYLEAVSKGEAKINSSALYPYELIRELNRYIIGRGSCPDIDVINAQWNALPNYVPEDINVLVMADVSGSMYGGMLGASPIDYSVSLALYFAERCQGEFHNIFMTFSGHPQLVEVVGETFEEKVRRIIKSDWGMNTNLERAFKEILDVAVMKEIPQRDMPKALIVITDMEFDACVFTGVRRGVEDYFINNMKEMYKKQGYELPNLIFWNVNSRHNTFHAKANCPDIQLMSGGAASQFKHLTNIIGKTPYEAMLMVIDTERYKPIKIYEG